MEGLIKNQPVVNLDIIKPGRAVKYRNIDSCDDEWINGIIVRAELSLIELVVWDGKDDSKPIFIHIKDLIHETCKLELLA